MQTLIKRFVSGESGVTEYSLIAGALMLIDVGAWGTRLPAYAFAYPVLTGLMIHLDPLAKLLVLLIDPVGLESSTDSL